jgi:signal peptidase I
MSPALETGVCPATETSAPAHGLSSTGGVDSRAQAEWPQRPAEDSSLTPLDAASTPSSPADRSHVHHHSLLQAFQSLLYIIIVALFIITFTVQPFRIPSASMEPTLQVGDFLLVDKLTGIEVPPRIFPPSGAIHRGDVIVFHYPVDPSLHLVKRVAGLPGDHLSLRDGHVLIDGRPIPDPYAVFRATAPDPYRDDFPNTTSADPGADSRWWILMRSLVANGELTIPPGNYFVLGDNRNNSEDSRYWGLVPQADIVGKPILIYFSLNTSAPTPGQSSAVALSGISAGRDGSAAGPVAGFARWERIFRRVR